MPNLKDLKTRINSVSSTQKITSAMKLVAAAKLKRAQEAAVSARPYAHRMRTVIASLSAKADKNSASPLLVGRQNVNSHLLVMISADKGLCGGFNGSIARKTRAEIARLEGEGKSVQIYIVGRKAAVGLGSLINERVFARIEGVQGGTVKYGDANDIAQKIISGFEDHQFDAVSMIYNRFINAITQEVTNNFLIPVNVDEDDHSDDGSSFYDYEPEEAEILGALLPRNLSTQLFSALLESSAAELAARMTAMDNATRNAGDMIDRLTLVYNRTRQANITSELIEIISGAEAL